MTDKRDAPYVWVTWLTKLLAGQDHCRWKLWFRANHQGYKKLEKGGDLEKWKIDHGLMVNDLTKQLREQGYEVTVENQNSMKLHGSNGATLAAKPDIIAQRGDDLLVIDCKSGIPHPSDRVQVMLYMLMLPIARPRTRGLEMAGRIQYKTDLVDIGPDEVDDDFRADVRELMNLAASREQSQTTPSFDECSFCDISGSDCSDRQESEEPPTPTELF